jgi:hypothetical protein
MHEFQAYFEYLVQLERQATRKLVREERDKLIDAIAKVFCINREKCRQRSMLGLRTYESS